MKQFKNLFAAIAVIGVLPLNLIGQSNISTKEDREALFNYIIEKTLDREAFSPLKEQALSYDPRKAMLSVKNDVINATNDVELYYALQKLSAVEGIATCQSMRLRVDWFYLR